MESSCSRPHYPACTVLHSFIIPCKAGTAGATIGREHKNFLTQKLFLTNGRVLHLTLMQLFRGLALLWLVAGCAWAQLDFGRGQLSFGRKRAVRAELILSHEAAQPGDTVWAAIRLTHSAGWHTYWRNPGDSGIPTSIYWGLPDGVSSGEIQWPVPEKFTDPSVGLITYVYHDTAVLLVPLTIANGAPAGSTDIRALVKWLECEVRGQCVPGSNMVSAPLVIGSETKLSAVTNLFAETRRRLPSKQLPGAASARWDAPASGPVRPLVIEWKTDAKSPDFFPFTNALAVISNKTDVLSASPSAALLRKTVKVTGDRSPAEVAGLLVRDEGGTLAGYEVTLPVSEPVGASSGKKAMAGGATSIPWLFLFYAFIGGLILNIMPCVLPVIALKILGFVSQSREHPKRVRQLGLVYTLGVLASFLVLAGLVIAVQATGKRAGWGMQFGNPQFIVVLTVIVTLVALNLFGVFEVTLSGRAMGAAGAAAARHGTLGAFMNGILATALATPCTAPFLGTALGFAFTQPAHIIVLFFVTIGLGLALPYLLLSFKPQWLKFLPKPGLWMERFKVAMGFPMLATALWLFSLAITHYGKSIVWLGVFLVLLAMAAWIYGEFVQRGRSRQGIAIVVALLFLGLGYGYGLEKNLRWRSPRADAAAESDIIQKSPDGIVWRRWSRDAVAKARAEGRPVFVDFTADWCLTCQANEKSSIEISSVRKKLQEINAVTLLGDYTKLPPDIGEELEKFGRAGVPLVLVYPKDPSKPAIVLPEFLTPGLVLNALEKASQ